MNFRNRIRRDRQPSIRLRETRRPRRLAGGMSRAPRIERLEARRLLAAQFLPGELMVPLENRVDLAIGNQRSNTEIQIDVNQTDPRNIAFSNQGRLNVSTDAGGMFGAQRNFANLLGANQSGSGDPDVVFDADGRLFWTNLVNLDTDGDTNNDTRTIGIAELDPATGLPAGGTTTQLIPFTPMTSNYDKQFMAADTDPYGVSPHRNNLYMVWTELAGTEQIQFSRSRDNGVTWENPIQLSEDSEGTGLQVASLWPAHVDVAASGDVYVAYHFQPGRDPLLGPASNRRNTDGVSGQVFVHRSSDPGEVPLGDIFDQTVTIDATDIGVIPDDDTAVFELPVDLFGTVLDVDIRLDITHRFDSDLDVSLISPDGLTVELFSDVGGSGDNFFDTILDDEAPTDITAGSAPFHGRFRPEAFLSDFDGEQLRGTWKLEITDDFPGVEGSLNSWSVTFTAENLKSQAFKPGESDISYNFQDAGGPIPNTAFWTQGAGPWVLADPTREGHVYVIANDDPDNVHGFGDEGDVVIARSTDFGITWETSTVSSGGGSLQVFPTAAIDQAGNLVVAWYDTRRGLTNTNGNLLLDVYATYSTDGGLTWATDFRINDRAFDPDINTVQRFPNNGQPFDPTMANQTSRMGEYFGIDVFNGTAYVAWNGGSFNGDVQVGQGAQFDAFPIRGSLLVSGDDDGISSDDEFIVRQVDGNPGFVEIEVNGEIQHAGLLESLADGIHIDGMLGDDTLTVDLGNGPAIPLGGITFQGGDGNNDIEVIGDGLNHGSYTPDSQTTGDGVIVVDGRAIHFTGLQPALVSGFEEFTLVTPNSNDDLDVDSPVADRNRVLGTSGGVTIEALTFFDVSHFKIDTATNDDPLGDQDNDDVDFVSDLVASDLESFTIETGPGDDKVRGFGITSSSRTGITVLAGPGNDNLEGGDLRDRLEGGPGNDFIRGNGGGDLLFGGDDSDVFAWNDFDGTDFVEGGGGGNDQWLVRGGNGGEEYQVSAEGGAVRVSRVLGGAFSVLRAAGIEELLVRNDQITLNSLLGTELKVVRLEAGTSDNNSLVINGTVADDVIRVGRLNNSSEQILGLGPVINMSSYGGSDSDSLTINGLEGNDDIQYELATVADPPLITLNGDQGDDLLVADAVLNGGAGNDTLIGGAGDDTINGNEGDDIIDGRGGTNTIDGGSGADTILVSGTAADETLDVTHTAGTLTIAGGLSAGTNDFDSVERVAVEAGEGSDTININTLAEGLLDYDILGGDPIGAVGDSLNISSPLGLTFMAGPEVDSGAVVDDDGAIISYDEIEELGLDPGGLVAFMGTGDDDDITAVGLAADTVRVTINDNPPIVVLNAVTISLQGKEGDDDITIDVNNAMDVEFVVDGGPPTAGSDDLRVTGDDSINDNPVWTPDAVDGGQLALDSLDDPIVVDAIEFLFYDGESNNEDLTVVANGDDTDYAFANHPGLAIDLGFLGIRDTTTELLAINYENLGTDGTVTADGSAADSASLTALGTPDDDVIEIVFPSTNQIDLDLTSGYGTHVDLLSIGVQSHVVQSLSGNDQITIDGDVQADSLDVLAGGPGDSDTMQFLDNDGVDDTFVVDPGNQSGNGSVVVNGVPVGYVGTEHLEFQANFDDFDDLIVNDDLSDNNWMVDAGPIGDRVQIDDRESIDFDGFTDVTLDNDFGSDIFSVHPFQLSGYDGELIVRSDTDDDVLQVFGTEDPDTFTTDSDTITLNGNDVTVGDTDFAEVRVISLGGDDDLDLDLDLAGVRKVADLGAGNDNLNAAGMQDGDFFGGIGDDSIVGSPLGDRIFGGAGNDNLIGGGGVDYVYGQDGDDTIGGLLLGADDPGDDFFFGGAGTDLIVWEPGDGRDTINGGDDGDDLFVFRGRGQAGDTMTLDAQNSHVDAIFNAATIKVAGVEEILVVPQGGAAANVTVNDLFTTETVEVKVRLGAGGFDDNILVEGRNVADNINITADDTTTLLQGLPYDVLIENSVAGEDRLTVSGNDGADFLKAQDGVEDVIDITLNGDNGDDVLSADAIINGGPGSDLIQGGAGNDRLFGGPGEDTFVGGDGDDTIDGDGTLAADLVTVIAGPDDFDTILIQATSDADVIDVFQANPTTLNHTVNGDAQVDTLTASTVEEALVVGGDGADVVRVNWLDAHGVNAANDALRMTVEGGSDATRDRLFVVDDGTDDLVLYRKGQEDDSGTVEVGPGNPEPLLSVFSDVEQVDFIDENGVSIVNAAGGPQLVVFKHDPFESNDDRFTATYLGSGDTINVDPTIDPGPLANPFGDGQNFRGDADYYRVVAETTGTLDFQVYFRQVPDLPNGRPGLPNDGNLDINVRDAAGNVIANFGLNDADDDERVRIPAVEGQTYFLDVFGDDDAINIYNFSVVNHAPPTPFDLELRDNPPDGTTNPPDGSSNSDTGRSRFDNHTYDDTPTLFFRLDDGIFLHDLPGNPAPDSPPDEVIDIPFHDGPAQPTDPGYAIAVFDEGNTPPQNGNPVQTPLGFATAVAGQDGIYTFTVPAALALSEGSHFLTARVQMIDPANPQVTGFGPRSDSLEIVVDRTPPEVVFGLQADNEDGLHPDSDSGDPAIPDTFVDRITNDETPTFFGRAEANSIVRLYLDLDDSSSLTAADLLIGQTVAVPLDGTEQLETPANPNEPGGQWEITSTVNMNDPQVLLALGLDKDGLRRILLSAEDLAGNITPPDQNEILEIFVDTQGPQVTDVFITSDPAFNLFTLKPETPEPTPRVDSLTISLRDLPPRIAGFFYSAVSNVPPLAPIVLVGDHSGPIAINNLAYNALNNGPGIATGEIVLDFDQPLPDDRFTLTLMDNIIDPVGNRLDGESNAAEPIGVPDFQQPGRTSGDEIPGGDFIARFTVDSRPEVATWSQGVVYADINGNFVWDPEGEDNDFTNRDFAYNFGEITDAYFAGNFAPAGAATASGFDKLGAYGAFNGQYQFFLDTDDDGVGDTVGSMAFQVNAIPVAGNFDAGHPGDEIGAFDGQNWYLDVNGNNQIDAGERFATNLRGIPVVGDFNGDGSDDLATFNNDSGLFQFDLDRNGSVDDELVFGFAGFSERPVAGDMNLDGIDDIVLWVPKQEGQLPKESGEFHFLVSDQNAALPSNVFHAFSPAPLGNDLISQFGDDFALPLLGNFDPPIADDGGGATFIGSLTNKANPLDTTGDGLVTARDALVVINALGRGDFNQTGSPLRVVASLGGFRLDASGDGLISSLDALRVINGLALQNLAVEGESPAQASWAASIDSLLGDADDQDDDLLELLVADQALARSKS